MDWIHLHLALSHIPVLGPLFLLVFLGWSLVKRDRNALRFSFQLFVALAAVSIAIKFTGDFAAETVERWRDVDAAMVARHEQRADQAAMAVFLTGLAAGTGLIFARRGREIPRWLVMVTAMLAVITLVLMARTANVGGHIRHPEIRPEQRPTLEHAPDER
jgi:hypothetical protein